MPRRRYTLPCLFHAFAQEQAEGEILIAVDKITFTGSPDVGRHILSVAGIKKVTVELGNTSPVVVAPDADLDFVARRCAVGAYYNSGQVCISVQRIYSQKQVFEPFAEKFVKATEAMVVGDPLDERVDVGPMIDSKEVDRIEGWVNEARGEGAHVLPGDATQREMLLEAGVERAGQLFAVCPEDAINCEIAAQVSHELSASGGPEAPLRDRHERRR